MQAIVTKWTAPGKIRATAARGGKTFDIPQDIHDDRARHVWAARELGRYFAALDRKEYGTDDAGANWTSPTVAGCLPDGTWAHVYTDHI